MTTSSKKTCKISDLAPKNPLFSRVLRDSTPRFVSPSVGSSVRRSVGPSHFTFSALMGVLALLLLPKCSIDLNYGPCPPARDWGSRVSGLVLFRVRGRIRVKVGVGGGFRVRVRVRASVRAR